ncbi:hypothetical protein [Ktedonospora formicarum]|uniref:Uncharacterized protein n=1 Tax=Ktedonospora formicarum TaxID=2778364 RepID=A0A8J3I5L8_9CHLR|nr:hypothetical protein [Ktedonospora formicarum]GHO45189.1 hypothetical protein KSX_33520 [Ktedonospora formicarum]
MAWTNNPYCQLADVKLVLGSQSTANDAWITNDLIPEAQTWIDDEVGYSFQTEGTPDAPVTKVFSGNNDDFLMVGWVQQVTKVVQTGYAESVGYDGYFNTVLTSQQDITGDVVIGPENFNPGWKLERMSMAPFYAGRRNYQITGVWGYGSIPVDITRACARLVAFYVKMRDTNYSDTLIEQGAARQKYTKTLPDDINDILKHYRKRFFYSR